MELVPGLFGDLVSLGLSGLGGAVTESGVVSQGGCFQLFGKLLPQVSRGVFNPLRFVLEPSRQLSPTGGAVPESKCIIAR